LIGRKKRLPDETLVRNYRLFTEISDQQVQVDWGRNHTCTVNLQFEQQRNKRVHCG